MHTKSVLTFLTLFCTSACAPGFLYTDITRPECVDMRNTQLPQKTASDGTKKLEIPTTRIDLSAEWSSRAIGDIARKNDITTVHFCDRRTLSILGGIYRKQEIIIYGE